MKTISKREGKNYEIEVKGDLHKYPDGSVHTVKDGKAVWEEGSGGDSSGSGGVLLVNDNNGTLDKTMGEIQDAYLSGKRVIISIGDSDIDVIGIFPVRFETGDYIGDILTYGFQFISSRKVLVPMQYYISGETEEAARNAYPVCPES